MYIKCKDEVHKELVQASDRTDDRFDVAPSGWSPGCASGTTLEVSPDVLENLIKDRGVARPEAESVEGAITRAIATCGNSGERLSLYRLWIVVMFRLTNGRTVEPVKSLLSVLSGRIEKHRRCAPQCPVQEIVDLDYKIRMEELEMWRELFSVLSKIRQDSSEGRAGDTMHCGRHPAYQCPHDQTFEQDWSASETRQTMPPPPAEGTSTSISRRV